MEIFCTSARRRLASRARPKRIFSKKLLLGQDIPGPKEIFERRRKNYPGHRTAPDFFVLVRESERDNEKIIETTP